MEHDGGNKERCGEEWQEEDEQQRMEEKTNFQLQLDLLANKAYQQRDKANEMKARVETLEKEVADLKMKLKEKEEGEASSTAAPQIKMEDQAPWFYF